MAARKWIPMAKKLTYVGLSITKNMSRYALYFPVYVRVCQMMSFRRPFSRMTKPAGSRFASGLRPAHLFQLCKSATPKEGWRVAAMHQ